jgi:hypothetical protein
MRQGSCGITIVSLQRKIIFDLQLNPYWSKWQTKRSKLTAKDFETSEFHQGLWNRYLMLQFLSAHSPWNAISNLELQWSYKALHDDLVLPSAMTLSKICQREYALTMHAIKKQLLLRNKVSLALDRWTSMNKLVVMLVIAYNMDRNWALREDQLAFDEVDHLFCSHLES